MGTPKNVHEVRSYMWLGGYYMQFIKNSHKFPIL